jgi:hypothetical protein
MEEQVARVFHQSGSNWADILLDPLCALRFRGFIERQRVRRFRRKLIGTDTALREDIFRDGNRGERIRPAGVEGKMGNDLRELARFYAMIERKIEIMQHADGLIPGNQGSDGHDAAVSWREFGTLP